MKQFSDRIGVVTFPDCEFGVDTAEQIDGQRARRWQQWAQRMRMPMSIDARVGTVGLLLVLVVASAAPHAQRPKTSRLASAKVVTCVFRVYAAGSWKAVDPEASTRTSTLTLRFDTIDTDEGTARVSGMSGLPFEASEHIIARLSGGNLHFIAAEGGGPVYLTSVFDDGRGGPLKAAHTRHAFFDVTLPGFTSTPEQYYGACQIE